MSARHRAGRPVLSRLFRRGAAPMGSVPAAGPRRAVTLVAAASRAMDETVETSA